MKCSVFSRNALGLDMLLFSGQAKLFGPAPADLHQIGGVYTHAYSVSLMTVKGLYFVRSRSRTTAYVGAGAGWRAVSFGRIFGIFDETSLRKIRLLYSPKHDALFGLGAGAAGGAFVGAALVGLSGCPRDGCHRLGAAAVTAGVFGALGALIGMTTGAMRYPFNDAFDVYRGGTQSASRSPGVTIAPQVTQARNSLLVSVHF